MNSLILDERALGAATDLYQITMAAAYFETGCTGEASFELFVRRLPSERGYLVAAGLEQALHYLENFRFAAQDVDFLRNYPPFRRVPPRFFEFLSDLRFTGEVEAMAEGTLVFDNEPILRVTAPIIEAQIVETYLLSIVNFETLIATKAARIADAARGRAVYDFGFRRAHGPGAAMLATRASIVGGCDGTSNVRAARELRVRCVGTMAHSWIMAHDDESAAFAEFARIFPNSVLLIDTYDTLEGARRAARIPDVSAVRLDSGDLLALSKEVRKILDGAGRGDCKIVASGDLNEYKIAALLAGGAPVDAFGVGTEMVTSRDAPALGGVYKLVEQVVGGKRVGRMKRSAEKATYPGRKQVYRLSARGSYCGDVIAAIDEPAAGEPLLRPAMRGGKASGALPSLDEIRRRTLEEVAKLPEGVRRPSKPEQYPVRFSERLEKEREALSR